MIAFFDHTGTPRMMTFKQIEALYWIRQLGGFAAAARHLHTTQSAISKRIQELESAFKVQLFDRARRGAWLTESGEQMFTLARELLEHRDSAVERFSRLELITRQVRIGVTELSALTWLPGYIGAIRERYPGLSVEPDVDLSVNLRDKLLAGELDIIVVPDAFIDARITRTELASVENAWMAKPGLIDAHTPLPLRQLNKYTLLTQAEKSGTGLLYENWLRSHGVAPAHTIRSNSLIALIGLTASGLGVSYLPHACLRWLIESGMLQTIKTTKSLPKIRYVALKRTSVDSVLIDALITLARKHCTFSDLFRT
jgi:DNA-binding transcriptional LysR family regulator